jgi:peptide methionine sulfoxide reductase MsrA
MKSAVSIFTILFCVLRGSADMNVYFGCGCFWHVQHAFVELEMSALNRKGGAISARTAYAGGTRTGDHDMVCYHNGQNLADYGQMGHAEVVDLAVPESAFSALADKFWDVCPGGVRQDTQDTGGEYRSVVGLPGGVKSPLMDKLKARAGEVKLVPGSGNEDDTLGSGNVLVYDTKVFPAHVAEKYHQFHDDMMESYGTAYGSMRHFAEKTMCPGDVALV